MHQVGSLEKTARVAPRCSLRSALIVEDCPSLHAPLVEIVSDFVAAIEVAGSCAEAVRRLRTEAPPQLVLLDVCLPDGTGLDVLDVLREREPLPAVVALSGATDAATAFQLAQRGVGVFVPKPIHVSRVREAIAASLSEAPDLTALVRTAVGRIPIHRVEEQVRETMLREALARAGGNRRAAARLLSVSRQLLQHMIRAKS